MQRLTLEEIDLVIREFDEEATPDVASRALVASLILGVGDEEQIAAIGIDPVELRDVGTRYRANGVWDVAGVDFDDGGDENSTGIMFWLTVGIGQGKVTRERDVKNQCWRYSLTAVGTHDVEKLLEAGR